METLDIPHAFLPLTASKLLTLKKQSVFWLTLYMTTNVRNRPLNRLLFSSKVNLERCITALRWPRYTTTMLYGDVLQDSVDVEWNDGNVPEYTVHSQQTEKMR